MRSKGRISLHFVLLIVIVLLIHAKGITQITTPALKADTSFKNNVGFGLSYGIMLQRPANFWGGTISYTRSLPKRFSITTSLAFDQENDRSNTENSPYDEITNTFNIMATANYFISRKWSVSTGIAKGIIDDGNSSKQFEFTDGNWATGISFGYALPDFPFWNRESLNISGALEYNITKNEFMLSIDLGFGISY